MPYEVTAQDKRTMVHADSITFHLFEGEGFIRAHKRGTSTADGFDTYHQISVDSSVRDFNRNTYTPDSLEPYSGFHMAHSLDDDMRTLVRRIGIGCTLRLVWWRSNNNDNQRRVDFHRDELRLVITDRRGKTETYLVAVSVGPDNTARMVRCTAPRYSLT